MWFLSGGTILSLSIKSQPDYFLQSPRHDLKKTAIENRGLDLQIMGGKKSCCYDTWGILSSSDTLELDV